MKHFFNMYDEEKYKEGILKGLFRDYESKQIIEQLKIIYDAADIIRDIRFDEPNEQLMQLLNNNLGMFDTVNRNIHLNKSAQDEDNDSSVKNALEILWNYTEKNYQKFEQCPCRDSESKNEEIRVLFHLTRGNICLRISQYYFHNYNLKKSEFWENRAMEILWHGKQAAAILRDSTSDNTIDLYLRLIRLNLAKYYRDYARKNRRSDLDVALNEFQCIREGVERKLENISEEKLKRPYTLIWMESILNIVYIFRRKYQAKKAERAMLFFYSCVKEQLSLTGDFNQLIDKVDYLLPDNDNPKSQLEEDDLQGISRETFQICQNLKDYDLKRYFLLILLELGRIFRALHLVENYARSIAIATIADEWSELMDNRDENIYKPDHNLDAFRIFSNSFRKYIKFSNIDRNSFQTSLDFQVSDKRYTLVIRNSDQQGFVGFIKKLILFANAGHQRSKEELIKWYCFYLQNVKKLSVLNTIGDYCEEIDKYFEGDNLNLQFQFLKGLVLVRSGHYKEAIDIFERLTSEKIKETQYIRFATIGLKARYLLANCYMSLAEYSKAEKILELLKITLANAKESRISSGMTESTDAENDARIEIDLAYCYMQKGEYNKGIEIYETLYGSGENGTFRLDDINKGRRIMGLNNYAACCILSIDDDMVSDKLKSSWTPEKKIKTAYTIFEFLKEMPFDDNDPETNLLKGYYTICTGTDPDEEFITGDKLEEYRAMDLEKNPSARDLACIKAHKYFRIACKADKAFAARYTLVDENGCCDKGNYRNEVERISVYLINLIKINNWYNKSINSTTDIQENYIKQSESNLKNFIFSFPKAYDISLKAAIAVAKWILEKEKNIDKNNAEDTANIKQLYRSFSYLTIYEERGAKVFNNLKDNRKFRLFTAEQRGKLLALLLNMYQPIKTIKEECCFTSKDMKKVRHLVHYTTMDTLKSILTSEQPRFRINNCGYMNDVFEGRVFLKIIKKIGQRQNQSEENDFIKKYFPQLRRSHEDRIPDGSNVYIGSLSVQEDSFYMWSVYAKKETGCNLEFGKRFFDIKGTSDYPKALNDYLLSKYTDQDYPLYIVQYVNDNDQQSGDKSDDIGNTALMSPLDQVYMEWKELDKYISGISSTLQESKDTVYAFTADRINEIRFLFKDKNYEFEKEVRVIYTDYTDGREAKIDPAVKVPRVYVNLDRELEGLQVCLGSRIEDTTVDEYVTWLKHTKRVDKVKLAKQNRYIYNEEKKS